ncbi:Uma2 family endonuclease [Jiella sp. M17.18]|uniref:Uma2 family endonuclease n=1 Tax=Jiella sp. M17.18 TaxID=3234247 RepID=UPI0034E0540F
MRLRPFTVAQIFAMVEAGILDEHDRVELIGGELVPMSPKGIRHERLKTWVMMQLAEKPPKSVAFTPGTTFTLSADTFLEPDFVVYDKTVGLEGLNGKTCLLAIEIGDSSLSYDRGRKAEIHAVFGIAELWVIDAVRLRTRIHRDPTPMGYRSVSDIETSALLRPKSLPEAALTLAEAD